MEGLKEISGISTVGDTQISYDVTVYEEDETRDVPASTEIKSVMVEFEGQFNPHEVKATDDITIIKGQTLAEFLHQNLTLFEIEGKNLYGEVTADALEKLE